MLGLIFTAALICQQVSISVLDHGAKPDGSTDSTVAIKRALNEVRLRSNPSQKISSTLYFPGSSQSYVTTEPIVIQDPYIRIKGDTGSTRILNKGFGPTFIVGLRSSENTGKRVATLDPRYCPNPPVGYERLGKGRRLLGDSSIGFWGSSYDLGRIVNGGYTRWQGTTRLTFELGLDFNQQPHRQFGIFSVGGIYTPKVFYLGTSGQRGLLDFHYTTKEGEVARSFAVDPAGFNLISIKLDLFAGTCDFWVNGTSTRVSVPICETGLIRNDYDPFLVGCDFNTSDGRQPFQAPGRQMPDFTIYGMRITDKIVPGDPYSQSLTSDCIAQLYDEVKDRLVVCFSGVNQFRKFYGYHVQVDQSSLLGGMINNVFEDLNLVVGNPVCPVIQTVGTLQTTYRRVKVSGGSHGISIYPSLASYNNNLEDCQVQAIDYGIAASWAVVRARNIEFQHVGFGAVLSQASDVVLKQAFVAFTSPHTELIYAGFGGQYGGRHWLEDVIIDMEGAVCKLSPFYIEKSANLTSGIRLDHIYLGSSAKDRPVVVSKRSDTLGDYYVELNHIDSAGGKPSMQIEERLP